MDDACPRTTATADVPLFTFADIGAGRAELASVIRRLLQLGRDEPYEGPLDDEAMLDPERFMTFNSPSPRRSGAEAHRPARIRPLLDGTRVGLVAAERSGVWTVLDDWDASIDWQLARDGAASLRSGLERAFRVLDDVQPRLAEAIRRTTRLVVTFGGEQPNSFATIRAHGAIFLNWRPGDDVAFAIEELAHQGGHVLLTTMLFGAEQGHFLVPPDSPLPTALHGGSEDRTVLVALHAVFTEALMTAALWGSLQAPDLTALERHEVRGRLEYILCRFRLDLVDLLSVSVLSKRGRELVDRCRRVFDLAVEGWAPSAPCLDLSGQPYSFSRQRFLSCNPAPGPDRDGGPAVTV